MRVVMLIFTMFVGTRWTLSRTLTLDRESEDDARTTWCRDAVTLCILLVCRVIQLRRRTCRLVPRTLSHFYL